MGRNKNTYTDEFKLKYIKEFLDGKAFSEVCSITSWYVDRNSRQKGIDWQFTVGDARTKHKRLYPVIELEN